MDDLPGGMKYSDQATIGLISMLEDEESPSQRSLAKRIGVALGLTNSLLKRCIRKGFIKVSQAPAKRYSYYVTPRGFSEKSRLVAEYLTTSLSFFRQAKEEYAQIFRDLETQGRKRVALYGIGELAEIAQLAAQESGVELMYVIQPGSNQEFLGDLDVVNSLDVLERENLDAVVVACAQTPQAAYDLLREQLGDRNIYAPSLLHISTGKYTEASS
jgi:DNA-binding MarR family transcriptional regulator